MCGLFIKQYVAVVLTMQLKLCNPRRIILERRDSAGREDVGLFIGTTQSRTWSFRERPLRFNARQSLKKIPSSSAHESDTFHVCKYQPC